ncbi:restriction endonuclease [Acidobacteriota bacterium]
MRRTKFLGTEFPSENQRNRFVFDQKKELLSRHAGVPLIIAVVLAFTISFAILGGFAFAAWEAQFTILFRVMVTGFGIALIAFILLLVALIAKRQAINRYARAYQLHLQVLASTAREAENEVLNPFYDRYRSIDEIESNFDSLLKLLKRKYPNILDDEDAATVVTDYNRRKAHRAYQAKIEGVPLNQESLAEVFVSFTADPRDEGHVEEFLEYLRTKGVFLQRKAFLTAVEHSIEERDAAALEERLSRANSSKPTISEIDAMSGSEFEDFCSILFQRLGYSVEVTRRTRDQGADLVVRKKGKSVVIQAKNYTGKIGNKAVQEVVASQRFYGCEAGMVITNSVFTEAAEQLARKNDVRLVDRKALICLVDEAY